MRTRALCIVALPLVAVAVVACSGGGTVGSGVNTANKNGNSLAFGATSTTSTILQLTLPKAPTTRPRATVPPPPTTRPRPITTQPPQAFQIVSINGDNSKNTQFSPSNLAVYVGTPVHFQNHDTKPRSVVSNDGTSFRSPTIPPGGEWVYLAQTVGQFPYQDGTRPYAIGTLTVESR